MKITVSSLMKDMGIQTETVSAETTKVMETEVICSICNNTDEYEECGCFTCDYCEQSYCDGVYLNNVCLEDDTRVCAECIRKVMGRQYYNNDHNSITYGGLQYDDFIEMLSSKLNEKEIVQ